jgi:hypothetical protein
MESRTSEIYWAKDILLLFCRDRTRTAKRLGCHPIDWLKICLSCAREHQFESLRLLEEYVLEYRDCELGTSFRRLSHAVLAEHEAALTDREIHELRRRWRDHPQCSG